jgi:hypothetical protein
VAEHRARKRRGLWFLLLLALPLAVSWPSSTIVPSALFEAVVESSFTWHSPAWHSFAWQHRSRLAVSDIKDTHERMARIYKRLGIKRQAPKAQTGSNSGCSGGGERRTPRSPNFKPPSLPSGLGYALIIIVVLAMLVPLLFALFGKRRAPEMKTGDVGPSMPSDEGVVVAASSFWLVDLSHCRQLMAAGKVVEAFAALHRAALLGLSKRGDLQLESTTTNWEYVRALTSKPSLRQLLSEVTIAAESSVLGKEPPGEQRFDELASMVEQHLRPEGAAS